MIFLERNRVSSVLFDSDVSVVIPAYDEERSIGMLLEQLAARPYDIVVVDDGSRDETAGEALKYPVTLLRHVCNLGQGAALQTGITYALHVQRARFLVTFDADGQHAPDDIPLLIEPLKNGECDVTLGSRFISGGRAVGISLQKRATLLVALTITRLSSGLALTDTHNGLKGFTAEAATKISITHNRMAHASEIINQIAFHRLRYPEVPVTIQYTSHSVAKGQSIVNGFNIVWDMLIGRMQ